jgi:uncharacterized membrane protein
MPDTSEHAVIASFDSAAQAEQAVEALKRWDKANEDIKLGAIGVLTKSADGTVETKNYSTRNTGKGAKVGMGLGALAAVFSGGLTLIPTLVGGAVAGGALGSLSKQGLGVTDETLQQLNAALDGGRAALLVLCDDGEVAATTAQLTAAGGRLARSGPVAADALQEAAAAAAAAPGGAAGTAPSSEHPPAADAAGSGPKDA